MVCSAADPVAPDRSDGDPADVAGSSVAYVPCGDEFPIFTDLTGPRFYVPDEEFQLCWTRLYWGTEARLGREVPDVVLDAILEQVGNGPRPKKHGKFVSRYEMCSKELRRLLKRRVNQIYRYRQRDEGYWQLYRQNHREALRMRNRKSYYKVRYGEIYTERWHAAEERRFKGRNQDGVPGGCRTDQDED